MIPRSRLVEALRGRGYTFKAETRAAALAALPLVFFGLGVARLLVLAVPAAVVGSYVVAIHAGMSFESVALWRVHPGPAAGRAASKVGGPDRA